MRKADDVGDAVIIIANDEPLAGSIYRPVLFFVCRGSKPGEGWPETKAEEAIISTHTISRNHRGD
jgi:hypothetical protein